MKARTWLGVGLILASLCCGSQTAPLWAATEAPPIAQETIVLIRHGEKSPLGLGQLDCQGLRRSLALPAMLIGRFGRPDYIFAPNPGHRMNDSRVSYNYIRPLATIEPTAILLGMPVNTAIGADQVGQLQQELLAPKYSTALVFVAWEHTWLVRLARQLMAWGGGDAGTVPEWRGSDYDGIFVLQLRRTAGHGAITFTHETEGLNNQPTTCPQ